MKRHVILSVLAAVAIFAVTSNANAGMFGRLHGGCGPCEPACVAPCEPACAPCEVACAPVCAEPCCGVPTCNGPFRPFGGFFMNMKNKLMVKRCSPCAPCEPACCAPCEPACAPCEVACAAPCEPACDPCGSCSPCHGPFRPFGGFFVNAWEKAKFKFHSFKSCGTCGPCEPICCDPCTPVCDPCTSVCN